LVLQNGSRCPVEQQPELTSTDLYFIASKFYKRVLPALKPQNFYSFKDGIYFSDSEKEPYDLRKAIALRGYRCGVERLQGSSFFNFEACYKVIFKESVFETVTRLGERGVPTDKILAFITNVDVVMAHQEKHSYRVTDVEIAANIEEILVTLQGKEVSLKEFYKERHSIMLEHSIQPVFKI